MTEVSFDDIQYQLSLIKDQNLDRKQLAELYGDEKALSLCQPITVIRPQTYKDEMIKWEERKTCHVSLHKQTSDIWHRLRVGAITMSMIGKYLGRCPDSMNINSYDAALLICGLKQQQFTKRAVYNMEIGVKGEPILRIWDANYHKQKITEVGVAVWKKDPRFRGSIDGEVDDEIFVEYKIPQDMYRKLIEHVEAIKKGFTPPPGYHGHIFDTHYDQITGNGVIMDKKRCRYCVSSASKHQLTYWEYIPIDYDHWYKTLYPEGVKFYDTHVEPLMKEYGVQRIDPY